MDLTNVTDTQETQTASTSTETPQATSTETQEQDGTSAQPAVSEEKLFTIKVDGRETQLKESELIKYAQLGKKGQRAMEAHANLEKKQKAFYSTLQAAAEKDVYSLYEALTGKRHPAAEAARQPQAEATDQNQDPRDIKLREYEDKLARIEERFENEAVEKERQAVASELDAAVKKYPELDSPYLTAYVKDQYRRSLKNGLDHSLEDIAFLVAQDVKRQEADKRQKLTTHLDKNKKRAPVITGPSDGKTKPKGGIEYARKLAGLE